MPVVKLCTNKTYKRYQKPQVDLYSGRETGCWLGFFSNLFWHFYVLTDEVVDVLEVAAKSHGILLFSLEKILAK